MSANHIAIPDGCLRCNHEQRATYEEKLRALGIHVEAVPTPFGLNGDVVVCRRCGQAWLLMPQRPSDLPT